MIYGSKKRVIDPDATATWAVYKDKAPKIIATTSQDGSELTLEAQRQQDSSTFKDLACVWALKRAFAQDRLYISGINMAFVAAGKGHFRTSSEFQVLMSFDGVPMRNIGRDMLVRIVAECLAMLELNYDYDRVILPPPRPWWAFWCK